MKLAGLRVPFARDLKYLSWVLRGRVGRRLPFGRPESATVLITYYDPARVKHLDSQVRNILRCPFVDRLVVSSHNPVLRLDQATRVRSDRLVFRSEPIARGCGHRWLVAQELASPYLIVVDDDLLLFPAQLAMLFTQLLANPAVPHGLAGMLYSDCDTLTYRESMELEADFLCEAYAVTQDHVKRYCEARKLLGVDPDLAHGIDSAVDFVLISDAGAGKARMHDVGSVFRCRTFNQPGTAVHTQQGFEDRIRHTVKALHAAGGPSPAGLSMTAGRSTVIGDLS